MIPPINCPYNGLTATPCWRCTHHIADTDECTLNNRAHLQTSDNGTSYPEEPEQNQVVLYGLTGSVNEEGSASEKEYVCHKCGGHMTIDFSAVLTSMPPKYKAKCDKCGHVEYPNCSDCTDEHIEYIIKKKNLL